MVKKNYRCSEVSGPDLRTRIALSGGQSRSMYFSLWLVLWRRDYGIYVEHKANISTNTPLSLSSVRWATSALDRSLRVSESLTTGQLSNAPSSSGLSLENSD